MKYLFMDEKGPQNTFKVNIPFKLDTKLKYASDDMHSYVANIIQIDEKDYKSVEKEYKKMVDDYLSSRIQLKNSLEKKGKELKGMDILKKKFDFGIASMKEKEIQFYENLFSCLLNYNVENLLFMISKPSIIISARLSNLFYFVNENRIASAFILKYILSKYFEIEANEEVCNSLLNKKISIEEVLQLIKLDMEHIILINENNKRMLSQIEQYSLVVQLIDCIMIKKFSIEEPIMGLEFDWSKVFWAIDLWLLEQQYLESNLKYTIFLDEGIPKEDISKIKNIEIVSDCNSREYIGLQITDMIVVLIGKLTSKLSKSSMYDFENPDKRVLLNQGYFDMNIKQYELIKIMYRYLLDRDTNYHFNTDYYFDESVRLQSYLKYIYSYDTFEEYRSIEPQSHAENHFSCFIEIANNKFKELVKNEELINSKFGDLKTAVQQGLIRAL